MSIRYVCRHCGTQIGQLGEEFYHTDDLGFSHLTTDERQEMIRYDENGDVLVKTVCEDCQEALERNPEYHGLSSFIQ